MAEDLSRSLRLKKGLVGTFQSLLLASNNWCPPFPDLSFNLIGEDQAAKLEEMFTEEEILAAVSGLTTIKPQVQMVFHWPSGLSIGIS